jgi:Spy/CpxP family protein refolding chaperone
MLAQHEAMWKSAPSSSAERYEQHSKFMQQRALTHEALSAAYKELYSVLTPEQRAAADQRGGYGPRGWR